MTDSYRIKAGYRVNAEARTFDEAPGERYWTPERLRLTLSYQQPVYELAARLARALPSPSVVDVGSGPALKVRQWIAPHVRRLVLVDQPSVGSLAMQSCPAAEFVAMNLERPDLKLLPEGAFDLAICADVVEHLHDPDPCLRLVSRSLKPDGRLIISTPERDALRGPEAMTCDKPEHVREWSFREFAEYLASRGWHIFLHQREYPAYVNPKRRWLDRVLRRRRSLTCQIAVCGRPSPRTFGDLRPAAGIAD